MYPYMLFNPSENPQFFNRVGKDNFNQDIEENFTKNMMDRQVEVKMKIVQLTAQQKKDLNKKYFDNFDDDIYIFPLGIRKTKCHDKKTYVEI